jgi:hypothetical protein
MTTVVISHPAKDARSQHRPAVDLLAEKAGRALLRWTERRAQIARTGPTPDAFAAHERAERIRRIRDQDAARVWSASPFGHR